MKVYEENDGCLTPYGMRLARKAGDALVAIADQCLEDGVDLRHASHLIQSKVYSVFAERSIVKRLSPRKRTSDG